MARGRQRKNLLKEVLLDEVSQLHGIKGRENGSRLEGETVGGNGPSSEDQQWRSYSADVRKAVALYWS
eukprot:124204-Pleurochrysis_carterae.AAC.1